MNNETILIVCAGRSRSGSTLLYNLIKITLIETIGQDNIYGCFHTDYDKINQSLYHVVKIHGHDNYLWKNNSYVFSSIRNIIDQKKSIYKFRKLMKNTLLNDDELENFVEYDYERYKKWCSNKNFIEIFEFEELVNNKENVIIKLCEIFNIKLGNALNDIIDSISNLKLPKKGYDKESCLTNEHFTNLKYKV